MVRSRNLFVVSLVLAAACTAWVAPASAEPPRTGNAEPARETPTRVSYGYVGLAYIAPVFGCFSTENADGQVVSTLCSDPAPDAPRYKRSYVRPNPNAAWRSQWISTGRLVFTAPYGRGWQWVIGMGVSPRVMPANTLVTATFLT